MLCLMVEDVGNQRHIVVQTTAHGNGQRLTSPCKKEKKVSVKNASANSNLKKKCLQKNVDKAAISCRRVSQACSLEVFSFVPLPVTTRKNETSFSVFLTTCPEMVTFVLLS